MIYEALENLIQYGIKKELILDCDIFVIKTAKKRPLQKKYKRKIYNSTKAKTTNFYKLVVQNYKMF